MKNIIRNENGLALPLALFVTVVLLLLGTTLWFYGTTELLSVTRVERNMKAHYLSRSGIEITKEFILKNYNELLFWSSGFYLYGSLIGEDGLLLEGDGELTFKREYEGNYDQDLCNSRIIFPVPQLKFQNSWPKFIN